MKWKTYSGQIFARKDGRWRGLREGMGMLSQIAGFTRSAFNCNSQALSLRTRAGTSRLNQMDGSILAAGVGGEAKVICVGTRVYVASPQELFLSGDPFTRVTSSEYDQTAVDEMAGVTEEHTQRWEHEEP